MSDEEDDTPNPEMPIEPEELRDLTDGGLFGVDFPGRIHPEGVPGQVPNILRQMHGDENYETMQKRNDKIFESNVAMSEEMIERARLINAILAVTVFIVIFSTLVLVVVSANWMWRLWR
jgi:hypothetical protein